MSVDRARLASLLERELVAFRARTPRSLELYERARGSPVGGVPMPWMMRWAGGYPIFGDRAEGARIVDVDGNEYVDLASATRARWPATPPPRPSARSPGRPRAASRRCCRPRTRSWVGEELTRRFGDGALAVHADRDRRQPRRPAACAGDNRAAQGARLQLLLPRLGRRVVRGRRRRTGRSAARATSARRSTRPPPPSPSSSTTSRRWSARSAAARSPSCSPSRR